MFKKLLDLFKQPSSKPRAEKAPRRDLKALASGITQPAIHVITQKSGGRSHFGGSPSLPAGVAWPERNGRQLEFLARLSLPEVHQALEIDWLPREGALLFFYDMEEQPWGFDPKERGSWAVLHVPDADAEPEPGSPVPFRPIGLRRIESYPSYERNEVVALSLEDDEDDAYVELSESPFEGLPKHQVSGYPAPIQNDDMELECQLTSHGLNCGSPKGYQDPRAASLKAGAKNWRLLFQIDSDDDLDFMWGDVGILYFWVEEASAREGDFSNVWLVLQCS